VFSDCGAILIISTCSANSDAKRLRIAAGRSPPAGTAVGGARAVRIAARVNTGVSCNNCIP
jgi:hypothetical protein